MYVLQFIGISSIFSFYSEDAITRTMEIYHTRNINL